MKGKTLTLACVCSNPTGPAKKETVELKCLTVFTCIIGKLYFVLEIRQNVYVNTNRLKQIMHLVLCKR